MKEAEKKDSIKESVSTMETGTSESTKGYRSIFKATSIFGGVQVINIIISLIRGKLLAVLIGTAGMGLNGLLLSSLELIRRISFLGLTESAIRDIAAANTSGDTQNIRYVYTIFRRWIWFTAIIAVVVTVTLSKLLSKLAFGDESHTISFLFLSITFIFGALTGGIYTFLQGMRKIKLLASANITGAIAGLLITIPILYIFGMEGIVPAIIASAFVTYLVSIYIRRKVKVKPLQLTLLETFLGGKQMAALGIILTVSSLFASALGFLLNAYITKTGGLEDLGIYSAGASILTGYVGMVFTAMSKDYYPRLAGVITDPKKWMSVVNQQAEIVVLILGPIIAFIFLSAPILIRTLLSKEFLEVVDYLVFASIGVMLRGISWVSGFILLSKGDRKTFLYVQIAAQTWSIATNILFYTLLGVKGIGIASIINFFLSVALMYFVLKIKYDFILSMTVYKLNLIFLLLHTLTVLFILFFDYPKAYPFAGTTFVISLAVSIRGLDRRIDLGMEVRKYLTKKTNR